MWVRVDTQDLPSKTCLRGIIIQSGNDACIVVAENIAGIGRRLCRPDEPKGARVGPRTIPRFANASGWPNPKHKMSMHDLGKLARMLIR